MFIFFLYQLLEGNDGVHKSKTNWLKHPFVARYIRINPQSWSNFPCLRVEVFGCDAGKES